MDKRLFIQVQGGRKVSGVLRGFDIFLNIVLDDSTEETVPGKKQPLGQVVSLRVRLGCSTEQISVIGHTRKQCAIYGICRSYAIDEDLQHLWNASLISRASQRVF